MTALALFFKAERVKWRKSWAMLMVLLAPLCQTGFLSTLMWFSEAQVKHFRPGFRFWFEISYLAWNLIMMPMVVALVSELSWGLEEESRTWDHLLAQPAPRQNHFVVKLLSHLSLVSASQLVLPLLLIISGVILRTNQNLYMGPLPYEILIQFAFFSLLAAIPLVAFHTWLSTRFPGLGIALATALAGTWLCVRLVGTSAWAQVIPWGMGSQMVLILDRSKQLPWALLPGSLVFAVFIMVMGTFDFTRRKKLRP